jgi:hypothetical protein
MSNKTLSSRICMANIVINAEFLYSCVRINVPDACGTFLTNLYGS